MGEDIDKPMQFIQEQDWISINDYHGICRVLEFKLMNQKTIKAGRILSRVIEINETNKNNIGVLLQFHKVCDDGRVVLANTEHINDNEFIPLISYRFHVPKPVRLDGIYIFKEKDTFDPLINFNNVTLFGNSFEKIYQVEKDGSSSSQKKQKKRTYKKRQTSDQDLSESDLEIKALRNIKNRRRTSK